MKIVFFVLSALLLSGCTAMGFGIANLPAKFSKNETITDLSYGDKPWQKLDVYIPGQAKRQKLPVIVFFYGGRWTDGSKEMYGFVGSKFADNDYVTVIADYSKYPDVNFPVFVEDAAKAVAWTYDNIDQYGGDPETLYISGHSAGAHIAGLVAADQRYLQAEGKSTTIIKAFAGLAGPYDFIPKAQDLKDLFGPPENYPQMQVTHFIEGDEPPMLLLWGDKDTKVWRRNIDLLEKKIQQKGGIVETKIYPGVGHVGIVANLAWFITGKATVVKDVTAFFENPTRLRRHKITSTEASAPDSKN